MSKCIRAFGSVASSVALLAASTSFGLSLPTCLDGLQFYTSGDMQVLDRVVVGTTVQAAGNLTVGNDGRLANVRVGGNLTLGDRTRVVNSAVVQGTVTRGNQDTVGTLSTGTVSACTLPQVSVTVDTTNNVTVGSGQTDTIQPGSYGTITVQSRGTLVLMSGTYQILNVVTQQPDAMIALQGATSILVGSGGIQLSDRSAFVIADSSIVANILIATSGPVSLGTDLTLVGTWVAPVATVKIQARTSLDGAFYALSLTLDDDLNSLAYTQNSGTLYTQATGAFSNSANQSLASVGTLPAAFRVTSSLDGAITGEGAFTTSIMDLDENSNSVATSIPGAVAGRRLYNRSFLHEYQIPLAFRSGSGNFVDGVNTFTGRHTFSIPLGSIATGGGVNYPLNLTYLAPTPTSFIGNSRLAPTGPAGFGWSFEFPFIVTDHKGTTSYFNDDFYANFGPWGGGQLVTADGFTFHLNNNPYIKITPIGNTTTLSGWSVQFPDGTTLVFGVRDNAKRKTFANGTKVGFEPGSSSYSSAPTFVYRWDVTEIRSPLNRGVLRFEWNKLGGTLPTFPSGSYTFDRESWPSKIWSGAIPFSVLNDTSAGATGGNIGLDTVLLNWAVKGNDEIMDMSGNGGIFSPLTYVDTRYLDSLSIHSNGKTALTWKFNYSVDNNLNGDPKRFLRNAYPKYGDSSEVGQWWMTYDVSGNSPSGWLTEIVAPDFAKKRYSFGAALSSASDTLDDSLIAGKKVETGVMSFPGFQRPCNTYRKISNNKSVCIGDFCYVSISLDATSSSCRLTKAIVNSIRVYHRAGKTYKEVYSDSTIAGDIYFNNGYFVAVDTGSRAISVYEWSGSTFEKSDPFSGDTRLNGTHGSINHAFGNDFFVIEFDNNGNSTVIPVVRKGMATWVSINRNTAACEANVATRSYSEIQPTSCIQFTHLNKSSFGGLLVDAYMDVFVVMEPSSGEIAVFRKNETGGFTNETNLLTLGGLTDVFKGSQPENLEWGNPVSLIVSKDMFAVSMLSGNNLNYTASLAWRWNGTNWVPMKITRGDITWGNAGRYTISRLFNIKNNTRHPDFLQKTNDGFALITPNGRVSRFRLSENTAALFTQTDFPDSIDNSMHDIPVVSTSEHLTAVHFIPQDGDGSSDDDIRKQTLVAHGSDNLNDSRLYFQADPKGSPTTYTDITSEIGPASIDGANYGLSDLDISSDESYLIGKAVYKYDNVGSACDYANCSIDYYYVPLSGDFNLSHGFTPTSSWIKIGSGAVHNGSDPALPERNGLKMVTGSSVWLSSDAAYQSIHTVFHPLFSSGPVAMNYALESQLVDTVNTTSLFSANGKHAGTTTSFNYTADLTEGFASPALTMESPVTTVAFQSTGTSKIIRQETDRYYVQRRSDSLSMSQIDWVGELKSQFSASGIDNIVVATTPAYRTRKNESGWAATVTLVTPVNTTIQNLYPGGARQTHATYQDQFNTVSGLPAIQLDVMGGTDNGEYRHRAIQRSIDTLGQVAGIREALFKDASSAVIDSKTFTRKRRFSFSSWSFYWDTTYTAGLLGTTLGNTLIQAMMLDGRAVPVNAQEITYAADGRDVAATWQWGVTPRNYDTTFATGVQLRPSSFDSAWPQTSTITQRSATGDVVEGASMPGTSGEKWSVRLHEGPRGLSSATFSGAKRIEVAALTGEDGNASNNSEIFNTSSARLSDGRWEMNSASRIFDSTISHTGKWSIRVENEYGPTTNVALDGILARKDGFTVSGWAYSEGTIAPALYVQLWKANCAGNNCVTGGLSATADGGYKPGVWQHWSGTIPYSQLKAASPGLGGYARVFFGISGTGTKVWIDDIQVAPASASISSSLQAYDNQGRQTATISMNGRMAIREYNGKGEVQSIRDERGRIFSQSTTISAGEN